MPSLIWGIPILVKAILPCALQLPMESHTLPLLLLTKFLFNIEQISVQWNSNTLWTVPM